MTDLEVKYNTLKNEQAKVEETTRSNKAKEFETWRHNANEELLNQYGTNMKYVADVTKSGTTLWDKAILNAGALAEVGAGSGMNALTRANMHYDYDSDVDVKKLNGSTVL